jgi:hypothetical protein
LRNYSGLSVYSCSGEALNGTIINGKVVLCIAENFGPTADIIPDVITNVKTGGASGLIFALYTIDVLMSTDDCLGMACVIVDIDIGFQAATYIGSQRLEAHFCDLSRLVDIVFSIIIRRLR